MPLLNELFREMLHAQVRLLAVEEEAVESICQLVRAVVSLRGHVVALNVQKQETCSDLFAFTRFANRSNARLA